MEFVRFNIIYAIFNPTPKGVGYVLAFYLTYFAIQNLSHPPRLTRKRAKYGKQ